MTGFNHANKKKVANTTEDDEVKIPKFVRRSFWRSVFADRLISSLWIMHDRHKSDWVSIQNCVDILAQAKLRFS